MSETLLERRIVTLHRLSEVLDAGYAVTVITGRDMTFAEFEEAPDLVFRFLWASRGVQGVIIDLAGDDARAFADLVAWARKERRTGLLNTLRHDLTTPAIIWAARPLDNCSDLTD